MLLTNLLKKLIKQRFVGFSLVGGLVLLCGLILMTFLVEVANTNKILASIIVTTFSLETNFLLNKTLNWKDRKGSLVSQWLKFHGARSLTIIFNQLLFAALITLGIHYLVATLIGTAIATILNYFGNDKFVFSGGQHVYEKIS